MGYKFKPIKLKSINVKYHGADKINYLDDSSSESTWKAPTYKKSKYLTHYVSDCVKNMRAIRKKTLGNVESARNVAAMKGRVMRGM